MPNEIERLSFDYSILNQDQKKQITECEHEIEDILTSSSYRIGKVLLKAKDSMDHGCFGDWLKKRWGWSERTARNMMDIARNFKSAQCADLFPKAAQNKLAPTSVPDNVRQSAIELAENGIRVDHKMVDELKAKDKELQEIKARLDEKITPSIENLIPRLKELFDKGQIQKKVALTYSQLPQEEQKIFVQIEEYKSFSQRELKRLDDERLALSEKENEAHRKADEALKQVATMQNQFEEAIGKGTQEILAAKDKEIELAKKEVAQAKVDIRAQIETSIRAAVDLEYQDEIIKAREDKEKAEKAKKEAQDKASAAHRRQGELEHDVKKLEEQIEVNNPTNVDLAMEKQIRSLENSVYFLIRDLKNDMAKIGGGMERSIAAMEVLRDGISHKLTELMEDSEAIINV